MPSKPQRRTTLLAAAAAAGLALAGTGGAGADARVMSVQGGGAVSVNVSFNTQMPLADMSDKALAATQKRGRISFYRMVTEECAVLLQTIAESCRLANLSVSTQVRDQNTNSPPFMYINGSAHYMVTLKNKGGQSAAPAKP